MALSPSLLSAALLVGAGSLLAMPDVDRLCPPRPETSARFVEGSYPPAARPYREAALKVFSYMTSTPAMRTLVETGVPENGYQHNAYVSKTHAAHVCQMLGYARIDPSGREKAMRFAKASAEYLLSQLEPPDAPLAHWPPTYGRRPLAYDPKKDGDGNRRSMVGNEPKGAVLYRGEVMLLYPADVGEAFLRYYAETRDERFLRAAVGIGETYLKVRRPDGSWSLKMRLATGEEIGVNTLVPTRPLVLFNALHAATGDRRWKDAADAAFAWLEAHPLRNWNWDGQFEDVRPERPYANPTKHNAVETMFEILARFPGDRGRLAQARAIMKFCEDRFVCWQTPTNHPAWTTPSVLEQYSCFVPIDASAAKMIRGYLALWRATKDPALLAKARAIGDTVTRMQEADGRIPTFWTHDWLADRRYDWLNCMGAAAEALIELSEAVEPPPRAGSTVYGDPAPGAGENGYAVTVDGVAATVSDVRCSAMPFNRRWPGHQRDIAQTEICGMVRFAFAGRAHVVVTAPRDFGTVRVRPYSRGVAPVRRGRAVELDIVEPGWYSVEFDGCHRNLNLFADPPETRRPDASVANVRRFGPGVHDVGLVTLRSGETAYLDGGAVVYGGFRASNATDVAILGRGIIDGSRLKEEILFAATGDGGMAVPNARREHAIHLVDCRGVTIDGVTIRDSLLYGVGMWGCEDLSVRDVKIIGQWRYNTDGIDLHNCRRGRVSGCAVRSFDDSFCFKAHEGHGDCEDLTVERCTVWNDWGKALEVGVECRAEHLRRLVYRDCDVIHAVKRTMNVQNVDYGRVSDVLFENIRIEGDEPMPEPQIQRADDSPFDATRGLDRATAVFSAAVEFHPEYSVENGGRWKGGGAIDGVTLRNICVTSATDRVWMAFKGLDAAHAPRNLVVENLVVNGRPIASADQVEMTRDAFAEPPRFLVDDVVRMDSTEMNRVAVGAEGGAGEVKVLVIGNSIVLHGIAPKIGWTNEWGMAASARERDFAHLVVRGIERQTGKRAAFRIRNAYELECDPSGYDFRANYAEDIAWRPDVVVVALGENVRRIEDPAVAEAFRAALVRVGEAFRAARPGVRMAYRSVFWSNEAKTAQIRAAAERVGAAFVDLGDMGDRPECRADGLFAHKGVAKHPGDRGMSEMADRVLEALGR